jgi:hypothetical protein
MKRNASIGATKAAYTPSRTPRSVRILAWLQIVQSLGTLLIGLAHTVQAGAILGGLPLPLPFIIIQNPVLTFERSLAQLLLSFPIFWAGLALFRRRPWAWLSSMTLQGVVLFLNLISYFRGGANYASMAISVLIVLYLNHAEVREAFQKQAVPDEYAEAGEGLAQ